MRSIGVLAYARPRIIADWTGCIEQPGCFGNLTSVDPRQLLDPVARISVAKIAIETKGRAATDLIARSQDKFDRCIQFVFSDS